MGFSKRLQRGGRNWKSAEELGVGGSEGGGQGSAKPPSPPPPDCPRCYFTLYFTPKVSSPGSGSCTGWLMHGRKKNFFFRLNSTLRNKSFLRLFPLDPKGVRRVHTKSFPSASVRELCRRRVRAGPTSGPVLCVPQGGFSSLPTRSVDTGAPRSRDLCLGQ